MKLALATVGAVVALLATASASSGNAASQFHPAGVVPHAGVVGTAAAQAFGTLRPASPNDLLLNTQPCSLANFCWVMRTNRTYAIYWVPSGSTACGGSPCHVSASYQTLIDKYFTDVAAASGSTDNVYSTDTQYYDATDAIAYQSAFAGSYTDTATTFPSPNNCDDAVDAVCLTDSDIEAEIQHVLSVEDWHGSTTTMFFVMTPDGVGSCFDSSSTECTTNVYCAYHSGFFDSNDEPVIYGNEPYDATAPGCFDGTSPNGDDADAAINTISHEQNEAITDPALDAWYNGVGDEIGDICAWDFGSPIGGTPGVDAYNQVINGDHYWLQQEYSNDGNKCVQHYVGPPANFSAPVLSGLAGEGQILTSTVGIWTQSPTLYAYQWERCGADGSPCALIPGTGAPSYRISAADVGHTIRSYISAQNAHGSSTAVSAPTAVVIPAPTATGIPVVSGVAVAGKTLSTTSGTWNTAVTFTYQWLRCTANGTACVGIPATTASTYPVVGADGGHTLRATVSATNAAGTATATSAATPVIVALPRATTAPRISGQAKVGKRLTGMHGTWSGSATSYRYAWLRCSAHGSKCKSIKNATHAMYRVTKPDTGHRLRLRVTAVNGAGSGTATSRPSKTVAH